MVTYENVDMFTSLSIDFTTKVFGSVKHGMTICDLTKAKHIATAMDT